MSIILKAIRSKCLDCSGGQIDEVRECTIQNCTLYPYRMGRNPFSNRKGPGNIEALKKYRENQAKNKE
ncbi:MAG TPA: hypothetical protein DDW50_01775 [Firmicutes bacterium]|jgi:hypothetical protein|nr:hypothetical protein [Bacillota bacterium]